MADRPAAQGWHDDQTALLDGGFRLVVYLALAAGLLLGVRLVAGGLGDGAPGGTPAASGQPSARPSVETSAFLVANPRPAPPLELTGPGGTRIGLASMRGELVLVFFGYTHCPDVCPATIGRVGMAITEYGPGARAIFVSVDPERDTPAWLAEYVRYMPTGFTAVTGTPDEVRRTASDWGVRYARVEGSSPDNYTVSHTADVFLIDGSGQLRATFPFGTESDAMAATLRVVGREGPLPSPPRSTPTPSPTPSPTATPGANPSGSAGPLAVELVSSSVWAGGGSPVILTLSDEAGPINDPGLSVTVQPQLPGGGSAGAPVTAVAVRPEGVSTVSWVATLDLARTGSWQLSVAVADGSGITRTGDVWVVALDQGTTARLGARAPSIRTLTIPDVGGNLSALTTDPLPDRRLSTPSTADALASGKPFVLVVDSYEFKVTQACGQALVLAKRLLDRWSSSVPFIHHEPYRYDLVTGEPVLQGSLQDPHLTDVAVAWGIEGAPWGAASMPWVFIVDRDGIVRAKYQGILGSADVDVMLSLLARE